MTKITENFRFCPRCGEDRPISEFYIRKNGKPGGYCKRCSAESARESEVRNKEKRLGVEQYRQNREAWAKHQQMALMDAELDGHKICRRCEEPKPVEGFYGKENGLDSYCIACRLRIDKEVKSRSPGNRITSLLSAARVRARKGAWEFNLTKQYLLRLWEMQQGLCFYTNQPMTYDGQRRREALSLDRKDPSLGYVKGNVALCCRIVNEVKSNLTIPEFMTLCQTVLQVLKEKNYGHNF